MNLSGKYHISAPTLAVWQGMNDPALLKNCIAVCESFEKLTDTSFVATLKIKIGPFKAKFIIDVTIAEANPPHSYRLIAEGKGGLAGFGRGISDVALHPDGTGTLLSFIARGEFGGTVARLAAKAMEGAAMRYADEFFHAFSEQVSSIPQ